MGKHPNSATMEAITLVVEMVKIGKIKMEETKSIMRMKGKIVERI